MTPRDVDDLTDDEWRAFVRYMRKESKDLEAAARKAKARR